MTMAPMDTATPTATTCRAATLADMPRLVEMFEAFRSTSYYAQYGPAHPEISTPTIAQQVSAGTVFVVERDEQVVGMIGLLLAPNLWTGEVFATELFWWVSPSDRGRAGLALLRHAEAWARAQGVVRLIMVSPLDRRVDQIYERLGYRPVEHLWEKPLGWFNQYAPTREPSFDGVRVCGRVLDDPVAYRAAALAQRFQAVHDGPVTFRRIAPCADPTVPMWIANKWPELKPTLSFFRRGEFGQAEPHYIHTDASMGEWTAILYLNPTPPEEDGTVFWKHLPEGETGSLLMTKEEGERWADPTVWVSWLKVNAVFNRLVLFPAHYYHSRAIRENYGVGDDARLVQVVFGTGGLS